MFTFSVWECKSNVEGTTYGEVALDLLALEQSRGHNDVNVSDFGPVGGGSRAGRRVSWWQP